ncbi:MAG: hypothetical protein CMH56_11665 [Myxococcales bacterium]|nr:hypothetical protein [Myxococcales bacterium]
MEGQQPTPDAFFGRAQEWETFNELWLQVHKGQPAAHIFCAGAGMGKTALLRAFERRLQTRGFKTLFLRPSGGLSKGHLEFVREAVLTLCGEGERAHEFQEKHIRYLERIGYPPEHTDRLMRLWGPESRRTRLTHEEEAFLTDDAIRQVFLLTANKFGLGLLVDDFGLCDQASQRFWLHLIQLVKKHNAQFETKGLLLLASTRQPANDHRCLGMSASTLAPLQSNGAKQMVGHQLNALEIPGVLFNFLNDRAKGNPRFLQALTQYLQDHDFIEVISSNAHLKRELSSRRIPETLLELTEAKIEQCSNDSITFLSYACLLQQPFSAQLIHLTTQHSVDQKTALWECEQKGIIQKIPGTEHQWRFEQRRYREVVRAQLTKDDTHRYQKRLAKTLAQSTAAKVDHHAEQLAMLYDAINEPTQAEKWYGKAADHAYRSGQLEHAAQLYAACLERMGRLWQSNTHDLDTIKRGFKMLARMLSAMNTFAPQKTVSANFDFLEKEAAEKAPLNAAQVCWQKARGYQLKSQHENALRMLDRADALMTQAPLSPDLYVRVQVQRAEILEGQGDMDKARMALAASDAIIKKHPLNGRDLLWQHQNQKGRILFREKEFLQAKKSFEKARQMAKANQDNMGESRALVNLAGTLWHLGQRHAAFLLMEQGESLAKSAGDQIGVCRILLNRGFFHQAHSNPGQAQECIEQALMLAETLDWSEGIAHAQDALQQLATECVTPA